MLDGEREVVERDGVSVVGFGKVSAFDGRHVLWFPDFFA